MDNKSIFLDNSGRFSLKNADRYKNLYFPLANTKVLKSSISPSLNGDFTIDNNHFLLVPKTEIDLHNSLFGRNVWFDINRKYQWALSGNSPYQYLYNDKVDVSAGFLYHEVYRKANEFQTKTTSFVAVDDNIEIHLVSFKNTSGLPLKVKPTIAIPIYGRSSENIRDHRHVTSLLNRAYVVDGGIINRPTLSFDERGHLLNDISYGVFAKFTNQKIVNYWPNFDEFIGNSSLLLPDMIKDNKESHHKIGDQVNGYEVVAGLGIDELELQANESFSFKFALVIGNSNDEVVEIANKYLDDDFEKNLAQNQNYWSNIVQKLDFNLINNEFSNWMKWVTIQPVLRRIFGNSFLPHHDYGRGGRGWRDLWQDQLALILMDDDSVKENLINNFAGIRLDGSNATIIGSKLGEFIADRNSVVRVWSDHACWPLFTVKLYLDYSGDFDFLFISQSYFKDKFSHYTKRINQHESNSNFQFIDNKIYYGSLLEHLLIENLVPFFNLGINGMIRLEDADWNDGLDMASENGETVAFTAFYGSNLIMLADIVDELEKRNIKRIDLLAELKTLLIDDLDISVNEKKRILNKYFDQIESLKDEKKISIEPNKLSQILRNMGNDLIVRIREQEYLSDNGLSYFNGYYDNDSNRVDDPSKKNIELTAQVFTIFSNTSTDEMVKNQIKAVDELLYDRSVGGYKLNTNFKEVKTNLGRMSGFAYGTKENGAMFSHMAIMYSYALLSRGYVAAGLKVIESIYNIASYTEVSNIYPGIPEYFNPKGRGMYHYLTGSASWLILTMVTQIFGVKAIYGELFFEPKLQGKMFINKQVSIKKTIKSKLINIIYINNEYLDYGDYAIDKIIIDNKDIDFECFGGGAKVSVYPENEIQIVLTRKRRD